MLPLCSHTDRRVTGEGGGVQSCSNTPEARHGLEGWQRRHGPYFGKRNATGQRNKAETSPELAGYKNTDERLGLTPGELTWIKRCIRGTIKPAAGPSGPAPIVGVSQGRGAELFPQHSAVTRSELSGGEEAGSSPLMTTSSQTSAFQISPRFYYPGGKTKKKKTKTK